MKAGRAFIVACVIAQNAGAQTAVPGRCVPGATCTPLPPPARVPPDVTVPAPTVPDAPPVPIPPVDANAAAPQGPFNTQAPPPPAAPTAPAAMRELLVAAAHVAESEEQRRWFAQQGIGVLRRRALPNLGWVLTVYAIPPQVDLPTLLAALTTQWPNAAPEENRRYTPLSESSTSALHYAASLVSLPAAGCHRPVRLAMLDGPINLSLTSLATRRVRTVDIAESEERPQFAHATGIAALLLGAPDLPGLLPNAELFAANIFVTQRGKPYTTTEWILRGLDWVVAQQPVPAVVNLSFGGPESTQLARAISQVQKHARVVAAAGNAGRTEPVFPAAYPGVVAVAAVDARSRRWARSNSGDFVVIAAPGVDLWTVDGAGRGYYASGTSFAAVYVSAALALGSPSQTALPTWLQGHTEDLGPPGRDRVFGYGLLRAAGLCD